MVCSFTDQSYTVTSYTVCVAPVGPTTSAVGAILPQSFPQERIPRIDYFFVEEYVHCNVLITVLRQEYSVIESVPIELDGINYYQLEAVKIPYNIHILALEGIRTPVYPTYMHIEAFQVKGVIDKTKEAIYNIVLRSEASDPDIT